MGDGGRTSEEFSVLDWLGVAATGATATGLVAMSFVARTFAAMVGDVGTGSIPWLTRLATSTWFPLALAVPVIGALLLGLRARRPLAIRRAFVVGAFVVGTASLALCLVGLYLPMYAIAGAVKAE